MDQKLLKQVKNFKSFLTVEELDKSLIKIAGKRNVKVLGKSEEGRDILCAKLGYGEKNAVVFGFPQPNEPPGSLTCISLAKIILRHKSLQEKYTWYIIPCSDPDGAKLNEGFFKEKFTLKNYAYNYFRSMTSEQADWSFPVNYKDYKFNDSPKNVIAIAKLIKRVKPDLVFPVHNSGFSGAYFFVTRGLSNKYYNELRDMCYKFKIPLDYGEPEAIYMQELKKPVYMDFGIQDEYEYYKKIGRDPLKNLNYGNHSINYALYFNSNRFGLVGEIPYFYDTRQDSNYPTKKTRKENFHEFYKINKNVINFILRILRRHDIKKDSVFYLTLKDIIDENKTDLITLKKELKEEGYNEDATVAEEISLLIRSRFDLALVLGETRRLLLESKYNPEIERQIRLTEKRIDSLIKYIEKNSDYRTTPLRKIVQFQLAFLFITLDYLN